MEAQHPQPASIDAVKTHFSKGQREGCVEDPKVEESPVSTLVVEDVEDQNGGKRLGEEKTAPIYEDLELPCAMHGSHRLWWIRIAADGGEMVCGKCERKGESH